MKGERSDGGRGPDPDDSSVLVDRAVARIGMGPQPTGRLAREVFGLRNAPDGIASRLLRELLGDDGRVVVDDGGVWRLSDPGSGTLRGALPELDYAVVDVETTGHAPAANGRIIEIAAVQVSGGRIVDEFSSLVNPCCPIPPWISRFTGISASMVADAPRFEEICELLRESLRSRIFVAHNASFDWRFVSEEMRKARSRMPHGPRLCTLRLARRLLPELPRKGLDAMSRHYGIEIEARHRAGDDALATASLLLRLLEEADREGLERWNDLRTWLDTGQRVERETE